MNINEGNGSKQCPSKLKIIILLAGIFLLATSISVAPQSVDYLFNDSHFHLTNYIQEGTSIHEFLRIMGNKAGRIALFGIPLQQQWSYRIDGDRAPAYYLNTDAPLYYYSFTDAWIAMSYKSLSKEDQARFDPMITGFNPADVYGADHIRRVLKTFPGVFSGIGEFTIHKEFVSGKITPVASLTDPALDRILDFAREAGLVVIIHNDMDQVFAKGSDTGPQPGIEATQPKYLDQMKSLFQRHPRTTIIWAHTGMGRIVRPIKNHAATLAKILADPQFHDVYFDVSWDEVAKYIIASPESLAITADLLNQYPDRFLFGTDAVAPKNQHEYVKLYYTYEPLWSRLTPETRGKVLKQNYVRIFDEARRKVREWERQNIK